jgi:hypothetical protein
LADASSAERLRQGIVAALAYAPLDPSVFAIDFDLVEDPQVTDVELGQLRLLSARELAPTRLLLDIEVDATLDLDLAVAADDVEQVAFSSDFYIVDAQNNDYFIEASGSVDALLRLEVTTDLDASSVEVDVVTARAV